MHGNNSYSVLGGYITQKYDGVKTSKNEEILFPEYTTHRNTQTTQADYQNNQQYLQLKANNRTEKHNISAQLSLVHNETPKITIANYWIIPVIIHTAYLQPTKKKKTD